MVHRLAVLVLVLLVYAQCRSRSVTVEEPPIPSPSESVEMTMPPPLPPPPAPIRPPEPRIFSAFPDDPSSSGGATAPVAHRPRRAGGSPPQATPPPPTPTETATEAVAAPLSTESGVRLDYHQRMKVGQPKSVRALLGSLGDIAGVPVAGGMTGQEFRQRLADEMEVRLTGPDFDIKDETRLVQKILPGSPTEWRWTVTPKKEGDDRELTLLVSASFLENGDRTSQTFPARTYTVKVDVADAPPPTPRKSLWAAMIDAVYAKPELIITAILIPLAAFALKQTWAKFTKKPEAK